MDANQKWKKLFQQFNELKISWQVYSLFILYVIVTIISFTMHWRVGSLLLIFLVILIGFFIINMKNFISSINTLANSISRSATSAEENSMYRSPIAILLYDEHDRVRWINPAFQHIFSGMDLLGLHLGKIDPELEKLLELPEDGEWHVKSIKDTTYRIYHQKNEHALYLFDISEEYDIRQSRKNDMIAFGYMFLDDYNEIVETMDDEQVASFESQLLRDINQWADSYHIYVKRLDEERFLLILNQRILEDLEKSKFKFFDQLKEENYRRNVPISISVGIAYPDSEDYGMKELAEQAQWNLDLAFGRGGDQIVVRSENGRARFYGGKSNPVQRRSSIRSRLVFQAFRTQIELADNILIAGHRVPDTDAMGSAIGVYRIATQLNKSARIIIDPDHINPDIYQLLRLPNAPDWTDIFVNHQQAAEYIQDNTLLVMVDHHRPSISEAEEFFGNLDVVILDHHRRSEEFPANAVLSYIETNASSTSELITEFFMSMRNTKRPINDFEATALLSGIIVDTNNFTNRTGSRTFEVASYLRSRGADTNAIQRILKEDFSSVITRNRLLERMEILPDGYGIIRANNDLIIDNIMAAQTADMMLDIKDVEASFVIYRRFEDVVGISARSLGNINVQIIMERLGGGGHLSNAATQMKGISIDEAYEQLIESINFDKGE